MVAGARRRGCCGRGHGGLSVASGRCGQGLRRGVVAWARRPGRSGRGRGDRSLPTRGMVAGARQPKLAGGGLAPELASQVVDVESARVESG